MKNTKLYLYIFLIFINSSSQCTTCFLYVHWNDFWRA